MIFLGPSARRVACFFGFHHWSHHQEVLLGESSGNRVYLHWRECPDCGACKLVLIYRT